MTKEERDHVVKYRIDRAKQTPLVKASRFDLNGYKRPACDLPSSRPRLYRRCPGNALQSTQTFFHGMTLIVMPQYKNCHVIEKRFGYSQKG